MHVCSKIILTVVSSLLRGSQVLLVLHSTVNLLGPSCDLGPCSVPSI